MSKFETRINGSEGTPDVIVTTDFSGIYGIFNTANGKVLIGSSNHVENRWEAHKRSARSSCHCNPYFQAAWNKYGETTFEFRVLEACEIVALKAREDYWMDYYHSLDDCYGYNLQSASRTIVTAALCKAISDSVKGSRHWNFGKHPSEVTKQKNRESNKGEKSYWYNRHLSEVHRKKLSDARMGVEPWNKGKKGVQVAWNKGKKVPRISEANRNRPPPSKETRLKMRLAKLGGIHTKEHNEKIRATSKLHWRNGTSCAK